MMSSPCEFTLSRSQVPGQAFDRMHAGAAVYSSQTLLPLKPSSIPSLLPTSPVVVPSLSLPLQDIPEDRDEDDVRQLLDPFPGLLAVRLATRQNGASAGHAFAEFASEQDAAALMGSAARWEQPRRYGTATMSFQHAWEREAQGPRGVYGGAVGVARARGFAMFGICRALER